MKESETDQRAFLLACAAWQDTLLQSYRALHVTIQGFLIASGAAVLAVQLTGAVQEHGNVKLNNAIFNLLFTMLLFFLHWLQKKTTTEFKGVIESRAQDINHWHLQVILSENLFEPSQRAFTYFKMWQHAKRASVEHLMPRFLPSGGISEDDAVTLVGKGLGHTRHVVDINLFERLQLVWITVVATSAGITVWFFVEWSLSRANAS